MKGRGSDRLDRESESTGTMLPRTMLPRSLRRLSTVAKAHADLAEAHASAAKYASMLYDKGQVAEICVVGGGRMGGEAARGVPYHTLYRSRWPLVFRGAWGVRPPAVRVGGMVG